MKHICIIAEAGVNHNGSLELAKRMVDEAKKAGVDYIKFQTFNPEKLVSINAKKANYQRETTGIDETQLEMLRKLTLTKDNFKELKEYCDCVGIGFISTPFDLDSIEFLETFEMDFWKIPSGEVTNLPYLEAIGKTKRKVIMSTGMCDMQEIMKAIKILEDNGTTDISVLHCNTQYPTPYTDVNLLAMLTIKKELQKSVGYSDHTLGIEVPISAVALGADIIEKHFTLDKNMEGPDHRASLNPNELRAMVTSIRNIEKALGSANKTISKSEKENKEIVRKSIVASSKIKKGEIFTNENLTTKRPGNGISPMQWYEVIGKKAVKDFEKDELIIL